MDRPRLTAALASLRRELDSLDRTLLGERPSVDRAIVDLDAIEFHLAAASGTIVVVLLGGTGTGKSTITNRLLGTADSEVTASSFRRTFTAGPVAIVSPAAPLPHAWLGLPHVPAAALPARGEDGKLVVVELPDAALLRRIALVDTPDVDGDQPPHHALADRAFRWAHVAVFVVSPEKYQMTELLPYYRLAARYATPTLFVMNKADDRAVVDDFERQLTAIVTTGAPRLFVQPRDDSTLPPMPGRMLEDLRTAVAEVERPGPEMTALGIRRRAEDVAGRIADQVLEPLRNVRTQADAAVAALREMRSNEAGVDVDPMTRQLRKRMQQRSILYLMGPGRIIDRLRTAPAMLARLPRSTIDLLRGRRPDTSIPETPESKGELPNFATMVADQFGVVQERVADILRAHCPAVPGEQWRMDRTSASQIVESEMNDLRVWLEHRWNANPRDTALILKLVQKLPGGERLTKLSESAPYLLVLVAGLHHFAFSGLDLLVIGGYSLATWLGERMSDEVAQRTRQANTNIDRRFADLVRQQTTAAIAWLNGRIPANARLDAMAQHLDDLTDSAAR